MIIDKDKFKKYLNDYYGDSYRVNDIFNVEVRLSKYQLSQIPESSRYYEKAKEKGHISIYMVETKWSGWILRDTSNLVFRQDYHDKYFTQVSKMNHKFNLENYQSWIIESRNKKIEGILEW